MGSSRAAELGRRVTVRGIIAVKQGASGTNRGPLEQGCRSVKRGRVQFSIIVLACSQVELVSNSRQ